MDENFPEILKLQNLASLKVQYSYQRPVEDLFSMERKTVLDIELPPELARFKSNIEATVKPYIKITAQVQENLSLWQSKFAGVPYLPKNVQYPRGPNGQAMFLLAQINFAELAPLEPYPQTGILQFYIIGNDLYGLNFEDKTKQTSFRVLYFPQVTQDESGLVTNFDFLPDFDYLPLSESCALSFERKSEPISVDDYQFEAKVLGQDVPKSRDELYKIYDAYQELFPADGHKIGGYPYFTQHDPRVQEKYQDQGYVLLFQMDTDLESQIMWGDAGVANFFVQEENLRERDFSRILYSWDCG